MYYKKSTTEPDKIKTARRTDAHLTRGHPTQNKKNTLIAAYAYTHIKQNNIYFNYVIHIYSERGGH